MTTGNAKQDLTEEVESADAIDLSDEKLKDIHGGTAIGPFRELSVPQTPRNDAEPGGGGATGSW